MERYEERFLHEGRRGRYPKTPNWSLSPQERRGRDRNPARLRERPGAPSSIVDAANEPAADSACPVTRAASCGPSFLFNAHITLYARKKTHATTRRLIAIAKSPPIGAIAAALSIAVLLSIRLSSGTVLKSKKVVDRTTNNPLPASGYASVVTLRNWWKFVATGLGGYFVLMVLLTFGGMYFVIQLLSKILQPGS